MIVPNGRSIVIPAEPGPARADAAAGVRLGTQGGRQRAGVQTLLQRLIMAELGFTEPIDPDRPLNEVGLDSLRSVTLANRVEDEIGVPISVTELISGPSIERLTGHVLEVLESSSASGVLADVPLLAAARANEDQPQPPAMSARHGPLPSDSPVCEPSKASDLSARQRGEARAGNGTSADARTPPAAPAGAYVSRKPAKWLVSPRPTPRAKARLFCFPYAGGGLVTFRAWPQLLGDAVEVVAVEPPGRGTRIDEAPVEDFDTFIERLLPELMQWIDRPAAFFGHCLGGLTMYVAACALPESKRALLAHMFACGARPPHLLRARGDFEDNLIYDMMLHPDFDPRRPAYAQSDEIFADIIRQFDTSAANEMLSVRRLREALLPTIRAEFGMAYNYVHRSAERFPFPITSFVGDADPWVSEKQSAAWCDLTAGRFDNQLRRGSHFLIAEDRVHILQTIHSAFVAPLPDGVA